MQRQSLGGSPSSKLVVKDHEQQQLISETQKPHFPSSSGKDVAEKEEEMKKTMKLNYKTTTENYIHLIPMLTLLCFLLLYVSSHDPSLTDLARFNVSKTFSDPSEIVEMKKGDILAIRSLKNLEQEEAAKHRRRTHRKIAFSA